MSLIPPIITGDWESVRQAVAKIATKLGTGSDVTHKSINITTLVAAAFTLVNTINEFSTDGAFAGNSDLAVPTEKAIKTYVASVIGSFIEDVDVLPIVTVGKIVHLTTDGNLYLGKG